MPRGRSWTKDEIEYLSENWGRFTIPQLAKKLNRSENAVKIKIVRFGLGRAVTNANCLNARQLSDLMGVDVHAVTDYWIPKCGLKAKHKAPHGQRKQWFISMDILIRWLENNQDKWDSRRIEEFTFGPEPDWLKQKRAADRILPDRRLQKWSNKEDSEAIRLFKTGNYTYQQIGDILGRSAPSVEHRIHRLDVWGTGKHISESERQQRKNDYQRKAVISQLMRVLLTHRNQICFDAYWQKDMCTHWDDVKGCTSGESDCDSCVSFQRIKPQYCHRCGATIWDRSEKHICDRCAAARKKQAQRKFAILHSRGMRFEQEENPAC